MKSHIRNTRHIRTGLAKCLSFMLSLLFAGLISNSALATVKVSNKPLTLRQSIPPNIVVIFDDSGSMSRNYMPDSSYLDWTYEGLVAYKNNGVYYNPNVKYVPPLKADGSSYPSYSDITNVPIDGFSPGNKVNLTRYNRILRYYKKINERYYFQYSTAPKGSTYNQYVNNTYYVAVGSCHNVPRCVTANTMGNGHNGAPNGVRIGTNIANWFAYYHTRALTGKSAMMRAFTDLNKDYRLTYYTINDAEEMDTGDVPDIEKFGDGGSGTRKAQFYSWLDNMDMPGNTPLRNALDLAGRYYKTKAPWISKNATTGAKEMLACRPAYTILMTDGFWNGPNPEVGNQDDIKEVKHKDPDGNIITVNLEKQYRDDESNTLADVAMKYWKEDLRTDMSNEVPTNAKDPAFWQHMTTFTLGLGWTPRDDHDNIIDIDQILEDVRSGNSYSVNWPEPSSNSENNIADLAHAGINGHGGFFSATNPQEFVDGLRKALASIEARQGSNTGLSANSSQLQTGTVVYQSLYKTAGWSGDLMAYDVDKDTGEVSDTAAWNAANNMPDAADRHIVSWNTGSNTQVNFKINGSDLPSLATSTLNALGSTTAKQKVMVNYLRGSHAKEQKNGGSLRNRSVVLGDIVNSQPVYVGKPRKGVFSGLTFAGSSKYATFYNDNKNRAGRIYVAANDGMLHAFDADTGKETFAYLPAAVIESGLSNYAQPDYGTDPNPHEFYNDGKLTIADAFFDNAWHTVLVGTTGRGPAKAIYALDVTNPNSIKVLWEKSGANSDYIGQVTGKPVIAQVGNGVWAVLVGNGYNSVKDSAALLQFDLKTGALTVHKTDDSITSNGLATPNIWIGKTRRNISTVAYAGDLKGNIWSFDLSTDDSNGVKLFTAKDASGTPQPITVVPLSAVNPDTGDRWLFFGTGRYLSRDDFTDTNKQTWYGIVVKKGNNSYMTAVTPSTARSDLAQRKIIKQTNGDPDKDIRPARVFTSKDDASSLKNKAGWYVDLVPPSGINQGERIVQPIQYLGGYLVATSITPKSDDVCNPSGSSWIMALAPFTGTNPEEPFFDLNNDGVVNEEDKIGDSAAGGLGSDTALNNALGIEEKIYINDKQGNVDDLTIAPRGALTYKLTSWRELLGL